VQYLFAFYLMMLSTAGPGYGLESGGIWVRVTASNETRFSFA
jgi:hypothetical protein